jgi:hypothetical protein
MHPDKSARRCVVSSYLETELHSVAVSLHQPTAGNPTSTSIDPFPLGYSLRNGVK